MENKLSRREFLQAATISAAGAVLSACAGGVAPSPTAPQPTVPAVKQSVTLSFWFPRSHPDAAVEEKFWKDMIAKFEGANPGIKVDWVPQSWSDIFNKIVAALESGQPPDITTTGFKNIIQYAAAKEVLPLDDVVQRLGGKEALSPLDKFFVWNGHWWGLPNTEGTNIFYYRKDLLKEAGFDGAPKNWDQLVAASKALTKSDRYGLDLYYSKVNWTTHLVYSFMKAADAGNVGTDGKAMLTDPKTVKAIQYYVDFLKTHKVVPPSRAVDTDWNASTLPAYGAGKVAMFPYSSGTATAIQNQFPDVWKNTGVDMLPVGPSGHTGHIAYVNPVWAFAKTKYPDEVKKFLEFLQSQDATVERARTYSSPVGGARGYTWLKQVPALWDNPLLQVQINALPNAADGFFPFGAHPVAGKADGQLYMPAIIQDIVVNNMTVEAALAKGQTRLQAMLDAG